MNILADTCFWISLCDSADPNHTETISMMSKITSDQCHSLLVPHPVLYETLCSQMVKKPTQVLQLIQCFKTVVKIPDIDYMDKAYDQVEQQANMRKGTASMVDIVIMLMAEDAKNNVKAILTRNGRDFSSFCRKRGLLMVENMAILQAI